MRRVLVTGGGSGIGRSIARAFAVQGDEVTIAGRRADSLLETARGFPMHSMTADVTNESQVASLFETPYDVVIANAGAGKASKVANTSLEDWNATIAVTLTGVFLTFRAALAGMPEGGRMIAIGSTAGLKGGANIASYAAAKHGVIGLVRSLALEVASRNITCNAICPGYVDTGMAEAAISGIMNRFGICREEALARVTAGNPMGRLIDPEEVAAAALYLASPSAASVNGHALALSGGEI
jgi:NAD(P)-dependent dehydrogenase (short-subunit alcohol dehydrogenase family)